MNRIKVPNWLHLAFWSVAVGFCVAITAVPPDDRLLYSIALMMIGVSLAPLVIEAHFQGLDPLDLRIPFVLLNCLEHGGWTLYILISQVPRYNSGLDAVRAEGVKAMAMCAISLTLLHLTYWLVTKHRKYQRSTLKLVFSVARLRGLGFVYLAFGATMTFVVMRLLGGVQHYISQWGYSRVVLLQGKNGLVMLAIGFLNAGSIATLMVYCTLRKRLDMVVFATGFLISSGFSLLIGYRTYLLVTVIQCVYLLVIFTPRLRLSVRIPIAAVILAFAAGLYAEIRNSKIDSVSDLGSAAVDAITKNGVLDIMGGTLSRFQGSETLCIVINRMDQSGEFVYGSQTMLDLATTFVPRKLWTNKPDPISIRFGRAFFNDYLGRDASGLSPTWFGETYWNFGFWGSLALTALLGVFLGLARNWIRGSEVTILRVVNYAIIASMVVFLTECPTIALGMTTVMSVPTWVVQFWAFRIKGHRSVRRSPHPGFTPLPPGAIIVVPAYAAPGNQGFRPETAQQVRMVSRWPANPNGD